MRVFLHFIAFGHRFVLRCRCLFERGMKQMKYSTKITGWGNDALFFLDEPGFVIIFNDNAPEELADISILHEQAPLLQEPAVGDTLIIGSKVFDITAVGEEAKHTLRELGHCTLTFKPANEADRPGCIMLAGDEPLTEDDIKVGVEISIY